MKNKEKITLFNTIVTIVKKRLLIILLLVTMFVNACAQRFTPTNNPNQNLLE